jgi:hypothetical protein
MASEIKFPASATTSSISTWSNTSIAWQSTTALYADDGADACITVGTFDNGVYSPALKVTNFDFTSVPADATITGIIARWETYNAVANCAFQCAKLLDTTRTDQGDNKLATSQLTSTTTAVISVGGSADLWGASIDVDVVKNANFGVMIGGQAQGNNCDVFIDYVTLEVCYTVAGSESNVTHVKFCEC